VSPKQEDNSHFVREANSEPSERAAAARLRELERLAPAAVLRFYDQPQALAAMLDLVAEGVDLDALPEAMRRMRAHPDFRSRKHPPQLQDWLRKRGYLGWLGEEEPAEVERARTSFVLPEDLADQLCAIDGVATYLQRATWSEEERTLYAATSIARDRLVERIGARRLALLDITIERAPAGGAQNGGNHERHA
jgi:hypothetical protein